MMPKTFLLTPPAEEHNLLGRAMLCNDIVAKLKLMNSRLCLWEQFPPELWWPGKDWAGTDWGVKTTLWLGLPGEENSQKISAINAGTVPEYTQEGPDGKTIVKGWRQIFEKVIKSGAVTREQIEQAFGVSLVYSDDSVLCHGCTKQGKRRKHNGGVLRLCKLHEQVVTAARDFLAVQRGGEEAAEEHNEKVQRRLKDVHVQVRGESQVGWTAPKESRADRVAAEPDGGVRGSGV